MLPTLLAILQALRALYVLMLLTGIFMFLFAGPSFDSMAANMGGQETVLRFGIGVVFFGLLVEHIRVTLQRKHQATLARALLRISPELRKKEAIMILIRALDSDDEKVVQNAHRELKRLANTDLGTDAAAWRSWLKRQDQEPSPPPETS